MQVQNERSMETAKQHLVTKVPILREEESIGSVFARLPGTAFDSVDAIYVVDELRHLSGFVTLPKLLVTPENQILREVMTKQPPAVNQDEDQERVVVLAIKHGLTAVPVVDTEGRFMGVVPAHALIEILHHEHVEDLLRLAGIQRENAQARHAIDAPPVRRARDRLPWLLVGLLGSFFATFVVSRFGRVLEAYVAVSFFIPGIVYLADAIGTQTEAIAVRGLSLSTATFRKSLTGELSTGFLIGLSLGGLSFPAIILAFGDIRLALAVSLTIVAAGTIATTVGLLLPWILSHAGKDPAFGSGPVATIIQDVFSLIIYFIIIQLMVV
ncbi:MAG TPA: magnesium transporter [Thermodesulfobacteriota bacterium]|nr:magnesium transporter [Thermodesulfobacteriota bacterium]